jgi:hypothetical protein
MLRFRVNETGVALAGPNDKEKNPTTDWSSFVRRNLNLKFGQIQETDDSSLAHSLEVLSSVAKGFMPMSLASIPSTHGKDH